MATSHTGSKHRMCRAVGRPLCGSDHCPSLKHPYPSGQHGKTRLSKKHSEYGMGLFEKQKLRFIYDVREGQFRRYFERAVRDPSDTTGNSLLRHLETRLDNIVYRLGFVRTIHAARQLVSHGHVTVNGRRVDIPSYTVQPGDILGLTERAKTFEFIQESLGTRPIPPYMSLDASSHEGVLLRAPRPEEIPVEIDTTRIVEFYAHA